MRLRDLFRSRTTRRPDPDRPLDPGESVALDIYRTLDAEGVLSHTSNPHVRSGLDYVRSVREMSPDTVLANRLDRMELRIYRQDIVFGGADDTPGTETKRAETEMDRGYVDLRVHVTLDEDGDPEVEKIERVAVVDLADGVTSALAESFAQTDWLQLLASRIGDAIDGETISPEDY